ncbi:hypothetical protein HanRHA438_Chr04g0179431 [Helianthus annuus]|nr:hypothetical protein HanRHA438_Chr04g0179431 [Helianthus annuus]
MGFRSERVQFELSFGPGWVSARRRFWIGIGLVRIAFRADTSFAQDGFQIATGFGPTRVSIRD